MLFRSDTNEVKTYGCRLNFYESEVIRKFAKKQNISNSTFIKDGEKGAWYWESR